MPLKSMTCARQLQELPDRLVPDRPGFLRARVSPRSRASSMTVCMNIPTSAHCAWPMRRSIQKNSPTGAPKNS